MCEKKIFNNSLMYGCKNIKSLKNIAFKYLFLLIILSLTIVPSLAIPPHGNQSAIPENKTCADCHAPHQTMNISSESSRISKVNTPPFSKSNSVQSFAATSVEGNITLISSLGQNWYQQGIYGPNTSYDNSWGWTFFDENPSSGFIIPNESVIQGENIYALLLDDGNNSTPISGATVVADVTYWTYDNVSYTNPTIPVQLIEDPNRKGFYSGRFVFYGGTSYDGYGMQSCDGCHSSIYGKVDTQIGYFPGNYTVSIRAEADGKIKSTNLNFEVTPWGCEDCHGSGNKHRASADMDSACYMCHGVNEIAGMSDAGNPHQNTAHIDINCTDCHTNKSLNPETFDGVTFGLGGINNNRSVPVYNKITTQLNGGTHSNLACTYCHNDLSLPEPQGGSGTYTINDIVNSYNPSFASLEQFEDYYVINVTSSSDPLSINLSWDGTANLGFYLYPPDFNPYYGIRPPIYDGATSTNKPELSLISAPTVGKWILQVYGYDLRYDFSGWNSWGGILQPPINYTINSSFPIQKKDLPSTPDCNSCHNSKATGGAKTTFEVPDWNPGFAHVDTNGDGTLDIQCRMCHDSMHDIVIKTCQNCHTTAPTNHPIRDPSFTQYTTTQCLACHGDPHKVTLTGGTDCIGCHATEPNMDVNISLFGLHGKINDSNGAGNVTNDDCWTCHYQKDMNRSNVYYCESCHSNAISPIVPIENGSLIMSDFMHDSTECRTCHAPIGKGYHLKGTVGPLGTVEMILRKIINP